MVGPQSCGQAEVNVNGGRSGDLNEAIRLTAYFLWEQDGRPEGKAQHYWELAKEKHRRERAFDTWLREGNPAEEAEEHPEKAQGGMP